MGSEMGVLTQTSTNVATIPIGEEDAWFRNPCVGTSQQLHRIGDGTAASCLGIDRTRSPTFIQEFYAAGFSTPEILPDRLLHARFAVNRYLGAQGTHKLLHDSIQRLVLGPSAHKSRYSGLQFARCLHELVSMLV